MLLHAAIPLGPGCPQTARHRGLMERWADGSCFLEAKGAEQFCRAQRSLCLCGSTLQSVFPCFCRLLEL